MVEHKPVVCSMCGKGYKTGYFTNCPHCGTPTGEELEKPKPKRGRPKAESEA